jgi:hypothetical protein
MARWREMAAAVMAPAAHMPAALPAEGHRTETAAVDVALVGVVGATTLLDHPRHHLLVVVPPPAPPDHIVHRLAQPPVRGIRRVPPPPVRTVYRRPPAVVVVDRAPRCRVALRWDPFLSRYRHIGLCN